MNDNVARFPQLKLFSLPTFLTEGRRRLELGVRGEPALARRGDCASRRRCRGGWIQLGAVRTPSGSTDRLAATVRLS